MLLSPFDWKSLGPNPIVGVDEVGRGCLAGPVYACAATLRFDHTLQGLTDSKLLSAKRREFFFDAIPFHARIGIGVASVEEIEQLNILQATFLAMRRALAKLNPDPHSIILVDGHQKIPKIQFEQIAIIKGDLRAEPIAAASIIATVTRDRMMEKLDDEYPGYGFKKHKGYGTSDHRQALDLLGPCREHRLSFRGVFEEQQTFEME